MSHPQELPSVRHVRRPLTQRELVAASLLLCPDRPPRPA